MANTLDADLVVDILGSQSLTSGLVRLGGLQGFTTDFSNDVVKTGQTIQIENVTAGATVQTNATNFESGDNTTVNIPLPQDQYSVSFHLTNLERRSGHRLEKRIVKNYNQLAIKINDVWMALILAATYTNTAVVAANTAFDADDIELLKNSVKNYGPLTMVLDGEYINAIAPQNHDGFDVRNGGSAYGVERIVQNNDFSSADTNVRGFIAGAGALMAVSAVPETSDRVRAALTNQFEVPLPDLPGFTIQVNEWVSLSGRVEWVSFDVCFGAIAGEVAQLTLLKSA